MELMIRDTNIVLDMMTGGILEEFFKLPYWITVPDILYVEELEIIDIDLRQMGLHVKELTSQTLQEAASIFETYRKTSMNDCFALLLAKQERCALLTGDRALREAAESEIIEVHGTIWIVEELVGNQTLSIDQADSVYRNMRKKKRRLPWDEALRRLKRLSSSFGR